LLYTSQLGHNMPFAALGYSAPLSQYRSLKPRAAMRYLSSSLALLTWLTPAVLLAQAQPQAAATPSTPLVAVQVTHQPAPTTEVQAEELAPLPTPATAATQAATAEEVATPAATAEVAASQPEMVVLKGKVLNEESQPLVGATVYVKGAAIAASTNANGEYTIKVPAGINSLLFSYIGYADKELNASNYLPLNVYL
jgi:hypothetical protein